MIASLYSKKGDYAGALSQANEALKYDKQVENSLGIAKDLQALGIISMKNGRNEKAYDYFIKSYMVFQTLSLSRQSGKAVQYVIDTALLLGKNDEAQRYRKLLEGKQ